MSFSLSGLGSGLAQGFAGYGAGVQQREQRDYERQQEAERIKRETERQAFAEMVQRESLKLQQASGARADQAAQIQQSEAGYAPFQAEAYGQGVRQNAAALGGAGGPMGGAIAPVAGFLQDYAARTQTPAGQMTKVRPSTQETTARANRDAQVRDTMDERAYNTQRDAERRTYDTQRDERNFEQQRQILREGRTPAPVPTPIDPTQKPLTGAAAQRAESLLTVQSAIADYKTLLDKQGPALVSGRSADRAALDAQYGALQMALKEAFNLGVLNGPDLALIEKQLTPPTGIAGVFRGKDAMLSQVNQLNDQMKKRSATIDQVYRGTGAQPMTRDESAKAAAFRTQAKQDGYSDEEIDAELKRRGIK